MGAVGEVCAFVHLPQEGLHLLDREDTLPAVKRGWQGLNWALQPSGKLGWVQQIGYDPRSVTADDNMEYGTGAFLLAGSEVVRLSGD